METPNQTTPMMAQWEACKSQAKDAVLLFRLGDFYEAFYEDAVRISKDIGLTLTSRQSIPMCGVPFHTADAYIDKLVAKGYKIAVAEQLEDPKSVKGIVKRDIVRTISPGTLVNSQLLNDKSNNYFASLAQVGSLFGLAALDVSTGELRTLESEKLSDLMDALHRLRPSEILVAKKFKGQHGKIFSEMSHSCSFVLSEQDDVRFDAKLSLETLLDHFKGSDFLKGQFAAISATGALLGYLKQDLKFKLDHVTQISSDPLHNSMALDRSTLKNLELVESLLPLIDKTETPMGGRLLCHWLKHPLLSVERIERRQNALAAFLERPVVGHLRDVRDLERLMMRTLSRYGSPRDLLGLGLSMAKVLPLQLALEAFADPEIAALRDALTDPISNKILSSLSETPPLRIGEGDLFQDGYHPELDRLRKLSRDSISWMNEYQVRLREETGIKTLKVGYTKAFGYYIEASRAAGDKIPPGFQRRQTLVNAERFITEELKHFEHQVLTAEERAKALEVQLFEELRAQISEHAAAVYRTAKAIAQIDALSSLAVTAKEGGWARPIVDGSDVLELRNARHPVVERAIGKASFIANDALLSPERQLMLITGPNMAGKSTYIRQVALVAILAQIGAFVPASSARIGVVDKIFSRIGASDDLARGQSTFMVEMAETANILNNATSRSLVLLDEIGRGTSTYDGIAIAWAVAEFLLTTAGKQAKTLFATHYWELTRLEQEIKGAINYQVAVSETADGIVFLRKIIPGGTDKSYGIHVAKLAGLPYKAIKRAEEMLSQLESQKPAARPPKKRIDEQLSLLPPQPAWAEELKQLEVNAMTPVEALVKLSELKKRANAL